MISFQSYFEGRAEHHGGLSNMLSPSPPGRYKLCLFSAPEVSYWVLLVGFLSCNKRIITMRLSQCHCEHAET